MRWYDCNTISKLLLTAAMAMTVGKNLYPMAPMLCGKIFCFDRRKIAVARGFEGKRNL